MRARPLSDERGIALAVAVFALVVIGALVAGTFFAGRLEQQTGRNTLHGGQAAEAAEAGLERGRLAGQTAATLLALPIDTDHTASPGLPDLTVAAADSDGHSDDQPARPSNVFLLRSDGSADRCLRRAAGPRSIGQLIRLVQADLDVKAGLTALGDVTITGGAEVTGIDDLPPAWAGRLPTARPRTT